MSPTRAVTAETRAEGWQAEGMLELQRWAPREMEERLDDVLHVYRRAFLDQHEADPARAEQERKAYARTHLTRPGLCGVAALDAAGTVVGIGYGQPGARGQWWHDTVAHGLGGERARDWLGDCFEVVELHVLPGHQGTGVGRAVLRALLGGVTQRTAALSALEEPGSRARRLYASEGFECLLADFAFPGTPTRYAILGKRLDRPEPG